MSPTLFRVKAIARRSGWFAAPHLLGATIELLPSHPELPTCKWRGPWYHGWWKFQGDTHHHYTAGLCVARLHPPFTCHCGAYRFPHKSGAGRCRVQPDTERACSECGGTDFAWLDFGIGPYEFWGERLVDIRMEYVCEACESASIIDPRTGLHADPPSEDSDYLYEDHKERMRMREED